jgi:hypothetical protein
LCFRILKVVCLSCDGFLLSFFFCALFFFLEKCGKVVLFFLAAAACGQVVMSLNVFEVRLRNEEQKSRLSYKFFQKWFERLLLGSSDVPWLRAFPLCWCSCGRFVETLFPFFFFCF